MGRRFTTNTQQNYSTRGVNNVSVCVDLRHHPAGILHPPVWRSLSLLPLRPAFWILEHLVRLLDLSAHRGWRRTQTLGSNLRNYLNKMV